MWKVTVMDKDCVDTALTFTFRNGEFDGDVMNDLFIPILKLADEDCDLIIEYKATDPFTEDF